MVVSSLLRQRQSLCLVRLGPIPLMLRGTVSAISDTSRVRPAWGLPRYRKAHSLGSVFSVALKVGKGRLTVSDLSVPSYAQGAVAQTGVAWR